jgi:hypothetical protein
VAIRMSRVTDGYSIFSLIKDILLYASSAWFTDSPIKLKATTLNGKAAVTWYNKDDKMMAGMVAHHWANDMGSEHKHWSVETPGAAMDDALQTRFQVPYGVDLPSVGVRNADFDIGHSAGNPTFKINNNKSATGNPEAVIRAADDGIVKIGSGSAADIAFIGNWTTRMTIKNSSGRVGIGTGDPNAMLQIVGGISTAVTATSASSLTLGVSNSVVLVDATDGTRTINLPTAVGNAGREYTIKKVDSSVNAVAVTGNSSQTVDGATPYNLTAQYQFVRIVSDGANWMVIGD